MSFELFSGRLRLRGLVAAGFWDEPPGQRLRPIPTARLLGLVFARRGWACGCRDLAIAVLL